MVSISHEGGAVGGWVEDREMGGVYKTNRWGRGKYEPNRLGRGEV